MRSELVIISDLWGALDDHWVMHYEEALRSNYEIIYLDARVLADIDPQVESQEEIHSLFVNGGIDRAAKALLRDGLKVELIIGCSVGGVIGWRAAMLGLPMKRLMAISSTRLRYESEKPPADLLLFYGDHDENRPGPEWFESIHLEPQLLPGGHDIYKQPESITRVLRHL